MFVTAFLAISLLAAGADSGAQKAPPPRKPPDTLALGEEEVKRLLFLIDADRNGKISKQEFLKFMEAEFDRLDVNKNGELDIQELKLSRIRGAAQRAAGKR